MKTQIAILSLLVMLTASSQAISVSVGTDTASQSMNIVLPDSSSLAASAILSDQRIASDLSATGQTQATISSLGGGQGFRAEITDPSGLKSRQISTSEGVTGSIANQAGLSFFTDEESEAIASGELAKVGFARLTDGGAYLNYVSGYYVNGVYQKYYPGLYSGDPFGDVAADFDSSDNAIIYVASASQTVGGKTYTGADLANVAASGANMLNKATGHKYISAVYLTGSDKVKFGSGDYNLNKINWLPSTYNAYSGEIEHTDVYYRPSDGYVFGRQISMNPYSTVLADTATFTSALWHGEWHAFAGLKDSKDPNSIMYFQTSTDTTPSWDDIQIAKYKRVY